VEKAVPHILQSSAEKLKVKNTELFKTKDFMEKFFHSMNILDFPATIQLGNMWRQQSTTEMLKRKGNFKRSGVKTRSTKKTGKRFTVIKKLHLKYND